LVTLSNFQIIKPPHRLGQGELKDWTLKRHLASARLSGTEDEESLVRYEKIFDRYAVKPALIESRYFECPDITGSSVEEGAVYGITPATPKGASIGQRTKFYAERANGVLENFYAEGQAPLSHLVHVTCTGYRSPSPAQMLVAKRGWGEAVGVTHAYHMGCYASLPAIRLAEGLVSARLARDTTPNLPNQVDIVHTEMCGLHMNPAARTPEQIVVQSLFADGHVKYSVSPAGGEGLRVLAIKEAVLADSDQDMSWAPEDWGLQMNLSREVPDKIRGIIGKFFGEMAAQAGLDPVALRKDALFAIHPGGPKIIQAVQDAMEITDEQTELSRAVLRERGNMSSATLPHVWAAMLARKPAKGTKVVSYAFGPGLTVFGAIFEVN
jgi:predicted naringenin-chalcone synthase